MTQSQIPPWLLTPGTRHLTPFVPLRLDNVLRRVAEWVAKPSRFNRLQIDPDKLMKTKGRSKKDVKNEGWSGYVNENK